MTLTLHKARRVNAASIPLACEVCREKPQVPWGVSAVGGTISEAAWKAKPTWYLLTTDDRMLPPDAQRLMSKRAGATVVEVKSSHAVYLSHPQEVAHIIEESSERCLGGGERRRTECCCRLGSKYHKWIRRGGGFAARDSCLRNSLPRRFQPNL
jgi:hypothetical protein